MSGIYIKDGTGSSRAARIDKTQRLSVRSVTQDSTNEAIDQGDAYNINTGVVTLTGTGESQIIYLKNNEKRDLILPAIIVVLGNPGTNGVGTNVETNIKVYRNPTGGTIADTATPADVVSNRNFGVASTLDADVYKGAQGATQTGGASHIESIVKTGSRIVFSIGESLPQGSSISVSYDPQAALTDNTMNVMCALVCHLKAEV